MTLSSIIVVQDTSISNIIETPQLLTQIITNEHSTTNVIEVEGQATIVSVEQPTETSITQIVEQILVSVEAATAVQIVTDGVQGPPGPIGQPGLNEEDVVYSKRTDFITSNILYKGEAVVGASETLGVWRIRKITIGSDDDVTEIWATGTAAFDKIWADRATYVYS